MSPASPKYEVIQTPSIAGTDSHVPPLASSSPPIAEGSKWKRWFFGIPGILCGATLGVAIGCAVQTTSPSSELVSWIGVPGNLFIRAIKCLVTPLVFCSLLVGMADMLAVGKASAIGWRTGLLYLTTTVAATCEGLLWVLVFRPYFGTNADTTAAPAKVATMALECDTAGQFLTQFANGSVACVFDETFNATSGARLGDTSTFVARDVSNYFAKASSGYAKRTITEALQGQLNAMVPANITLAFSEATLLSIIMFALPFGVAIAQLPRHAHVLSEFFREVNMVFMAMIGWVIMCTPIAIISLLAKSIAEQDDLASIVTDVGLYVLCCLLSLFAHTYVFYPILLRTLVRCNPFAWLHKMFRAQIFAFGCASSMATLPVVMECIDETREVSPTLSRFVLSLGATIGMDGAALGYPVAVVFMAEAAGIGHIIGGVEYVMIIIVSTIGAIGAGPVPAASIVMTMTVWASVFPHVPLPSTFAFIVATDWIIDRFHTAVNVTCDTVVCRIVAEQVGETITHDDNVRASLVSAVDDLASHNAGLKDAIERSGAKHHV